MFCEIASLGRRELEKNCKFLWTPAWHAWLPKKYKILRFKKSKNQTEVRNSNLVEFFLRQPLTFAAIASPTKKSPAQCVPNFTKQFPVAPRQWERERRTILIGAPPWLVGINKLARDWLSALWIFTSAKAIYVCIQLIIWQFTFSQAMGDNEDIQC